MRQHTKKKLIIGFASLGLLWTGYWLVLKSVLPSIWKESEFYSYKEEKVSGFPFRIDVLRKGASYSHSVPGHNQKFLTVEGDETFSVSLLNPTALEYTIADISLKWMGFPLASFLKIKDIKGTLHKDPKETSFFSIEHMSVLGMDVKNIAIEVEPQHKKVSLKTSCLHLSSLDLEGISLDAVLMQNEDKSIKIQFTIKVKEGSLSFNFLWDKGHLSRISLIPHKWEESLLGLNEKAKDGLHNLVKLIENI